MNPKSPNCKQELMRKAKKEYYDNKNNQSKPNTVESFVTSAARKGTRVFNAQRDSQSHTKLVVSLREQQ